MKEINTELSQNAYKVYKFKKKTTELSQNVDFGPLRNFTDL